MQEAKARRVIVEEIRGWPSWQKPHGDESLHEVKEGDGLKKRMGTPNFHSDSSTQDPSTLSVLMKGRICHPVKKFGVPIPNVKPKGLVFKSISSTDK